MWEGRSGVRVFVVLMLALGVMNLWRWWRIRISTAHVKEPFQVALDQLPFRILQWFPDPKLLYVHERRRQLFFAQSCLLNDDSRHYFPGPDHRSDALRIVSQLRTITGIYQLTYVRFFFLNPRCHVVCCCASGPCFTEIGDFRLVSLRRHWIIFSVRWRLHTRSRCPI